MAQVLEEVEEAFVALVAPGHDEAIAQYRADRSAVDGDRPDATRRHGAFERHIAPLLPGAVGAQLQSLKGQIRAKFNALAKDCADLIKLGETGELNGAALDLRHSLGHTTAGATS